jgi:hypothetical protein
MKKILTFLIFGLSSLFAQSIYPLPFTFDDSDLFVADISIHNFNTTNGSKIQMLGVVLIDANNNIFSFNRKLQSFLDCPEAKTLNELRNYKTIFKNEPTYCYSHINNTYKLKEAKEITLKNGIKILTDDLINDIGTYSSYDAGAIIVYKDEILGSIDYISPHRNKAKFQSLLQTIKLNDKTKSIDEYIKSGKEYINRGMVNLALKNAASALLVDASNKDVKLLLQEIYKWQKDFIKVSENDLKNLE